MIFISYRRDDAQDVVDFLAIVLKERFGEDNVFKDDEDLDGGVDWRDRIQQKVLACEVLLAVIGESWLTACDKCGRRRLDDPHDCLVQEICTAIGHQKAVIPLLINDAKTPPSEGLPQALKALPKYNSQPLRRGRDRRPDLANLITVLEKILGLKPHQTEPTVYLHWLIRRLSEKGIEGLDATN